MKWIMTLLVVLGVLLAIGCKPGSTAPKLNPDMGTQGGATQVDTETH